MIKQKNQQRGDKATDSVFFVLKVVIKLIKTDSNLEWVFHMAIILDVCLILPTNS